MLQTLRERPLVKKVVLSAVLLVMGLGIGVGVTWNFFDSIASRSSATSSGPWVVRVGEETISPREFDNEITQIRDDLQSRGLSQMPGLEALIKNQAKDRLIMQALILEEARRAGLKVSDEEVSDKVTSIFQVDGRFIGMDQYRRFLQQKGRDVTGYEKDIRKSILMEKWNTLVGSGAAVGDPEVDEELVKRNEKVRFDFVVVDPSKHAPTPTEADIKAYYEAHPDRYQLGEARRARYVLIDASGAESQVPSPTEDELKKAYEADRASFPGTFEQAHDAVRRQITFQKAQAATDIAAAAFKATLTDAASLDAKAAEKKYRVQDTGLIRHDDAEGLSSFGPAFLDAFFQAPQGSLGEPARTLKGSAVFVVTEVQPAHRGAIEEVRKDILADLAKEKGREAALTASKSAVATGGGDLAKVARTLDSTVQNGPLISKGEPVPALGFDQAVEKAAYETEMGSVAPPVATADGSIVVLKVVERKRPDPASLTASRETVRNELLAKREQDLVNAVVRTLLTQRQAEIKTNDGYFKQSGS